MIYLDAAATTKPNKKVVDAMLPYLYEKWYNPSSLYEGAINVKKDIELAREIVGNFIGASSDEIYFTSSGSESNCWAIQGFVNYWLAKGVVPSIVTTKIEHKSIMSCVDNLYNVDLHYIDVDKNGFINLEQLDKVLRCNGALGLHKVILVSVQFSNNEIGTIQHIKRIAELTHKYHSVFHTDAVQSFGKIPINVDELGIDMLSASGHKIGAPKGVGILYKNKDVNINPIIYGSQMDNMRGGTENAAYIVGMAEAVKLCNVEHDVIMEMCKKRDYFISLLEFEFGCKLNGDAKFRLPNNINVTFPQNITGEAMLYTLDLSEIKVATGSACNSRSIEPSHVLKTIGLGNEDAIKTVRFTLPDDITYNDINHVVDEIGKCIKLLSIGG